MPVALKGDSCTKIKKLCAYPQANGGWQVTGTTQSLDYHTSLLSCFSLVPLFANLWTLAQQALLSLGFSMQENWSGLLFLPPGDLPDPGIELMSLTSPAVAGRFFTTSATSVIANIWYSTYYLSLLKTLWKWKAPSCLSLTEGNKSFILFLFSSAHASHCPYYIFL